MAGQEESNKLRKNALETHRRELINILCDSNGKIVYDVLDQMLEERCIPAAECSKILQQTSYSCRSCALLNWLELQPEPKAFTVLIQQLRSHQHDSELADKLEQETKPEGD